MITVYHAPRSRSSRVVWLLEELGVEYETSPLQFPAGLRTDEYLKVNPCGRVPALRENGVTLFESGAICEYLLEKYGAGRLAPALGSPERPVYLQWFHFAEGTLMPPLSAIAQNAFLKPEAERIPAVADGHEQGIIFQPKQARSEVLSAPFRLGNLKQRLDRCQFGKAFIDATPSKHGPVGFPPTCAVGYVDQTILREIRMQRDVQQAALTQR